jgi:ferredoxin
MKILYFTATGNSLFIAKSFGGELLSIPQMIKHGRFEFSDDKIGIVFPIYGHGVPSYIVDFIKKAKFNTDYLFAIATFGVYSGAVAKHLSDVTSNSSNKFTYINAIKMVDNYLPGFDMKKESANENNKGTEEKLALIKSEIEVSKKWIIPENFLRKFGFNLMHSRKKPFSKKQLKIHIYGEGIENYFYTDSNCTGCGLCAKVCPVDNIIVDKIKKNITLQNKCFACFSCLHNCPTNNIHIRGEVSSSRYRNSHIKINEIIESNK